MGRHHSDPIITVKHVADGAFVVTSVRDQNGRLPRWIICGYEMSAAEASEFNRDFGVDTVRTIADAAAQRRAA